MATKFKLKHIYDGLPAGTVVYDLVQYDYGLANDDTRATGIEHTSVTLKEDGGPPGFTCPVHLLYQVIDNDK